ncbi:pectinesterase/pectinesterase inhibitor-like [Prosopis cineraria]|uniref:pectinesterase/pectinesterase inhibitor-like n=1 Tax=Prosopis cineraria TaxID=364024 RepID=UPI0024107AC2|nr:pectinesterase/pectinesterase inhibitor-like [Prosopis cineraria]
MQHTCLDGFQNSTTKAGQTMAHALKTALEMSNNALDIVEGFSSVLEDFKLEDAADVENTNDVTNKSRKLLSSPFSSATSAAADDIPTWVNSHQRRLLQAGSKALKADAVVAQDGTGQFKTLTDALKTVPPDNNKPFVIHVKAGIYKEEVIVAANTMNFVTIVGDGPTKTRFTGGKSQKDGFQTFHTSSFSVNANNFMAIDVGFENTAGPSAGPAVALRITGDKAVIYRCYMDGHQDTLYPSAYRQFYRDCTVWGTIDFIFGDAVTVFQNCTIMVKKGVDGQEGVVAAGGKNQEAGPSALVFQGCKFLPDPSYMDTAAVKKGLQISYLARPWKPYAKTVIIESYIHEIFNPKGYVPFTGSNFQDTCTALEYGNLGPGGDVAQRVKWPGVDAHLPRSKAAQYYPGRYFQLSNNLEGDSWIVSSGVPYSTGPMLASP